MIHRWNIPKEVLEVVRRLSRHSFQAYVVGGAVRDIILGKSPGDWDIATSAVPKQVLRLFPKSIPTGIDFGTVTVRIQNFQIQVTTFRREGLYKDRRRPSAVEFVGDLESDLARRDFTMNAMAFDPLTRQLFDPFHGQRDAKRKVLRAVGDAKERFEEDVLRAVRAGRFISQLGVKPEQSVSQAAKSVRTDLRHVSAERIRDELIKLLLSPMPSRGLLWLEKTGILSEILPELTDCKGVQQGGWHQYDVFRHTLIATDKGKRELSVRLSLLLHDIAKPSTRTRDGSGYHFYGHDRKGAEMSRRILTRLRFPRKLIDDVESLIRHHLFEDGPISKSPAAVRRLMQRVGEVRLERLVEVRKGDTLGCGKGHRISPNLGKILRLAENIRRAKEALSIHDLRVTGKDVMRWQKIPPGPDVGVILRNLLDLVIKDPKMNRKSHLKRIIARM